MTSPDPMKTAEPVLAVAPLTLSAPERGTDLQLKVSMPLSGQNLPIIIFSHGYAQSHNSYGPLANYWAAHGFVVVQPTHLDSALLSLPADDPRTPHIWRYRETDLMLVLDGLAQIEDRIPTAKGRFDFARIAVAGHSWGATSASVLLGATHPDPDDGSIVKMADTRVKAGVLLCVAGSGGSNLNAIAQQFFPFMHPDFSAMQKPALVISGDKDQSQLSVRGPDWWREAFDQSPAPKTLYTTFGGEHSLGGISDILSTMTTDESPDRVAAIQQLSTAYLHSTLHPEDAALQEHLRTVEASVASQGLLETK